MTAYDLSIASLFEKHASVQNAGFTPDSYKPGLERMQMLDLAVGHPSTRLRCIHVTGTNGKGSVCTMLAASLSGSGYRVGLYTSPHLLDFRERIALVEGTGTSLIPREDVLKFLDSFEGQLEGCSFFEITTAMAFWWFDRQQVDVAVIEVGLGGRLDSTNIITPEISIITSIGLDHCALLGSTREAIASEKAGIFKPGVPALVAQRDEQTSPVFEAQAAQTHCPLFYAEDFETADCPLDLHGPCQQMNLRTVLAALDILGEEPVPETISHAAAITGFRGRWERLCESPEIICDIGHNPPALKENFRKLEAAGRPLIIVYGIMADKDLAGIAPLMPSGAKYILVAPDTPRALPAGQLKEKLRELRPDLDTEAAPDVEAGVRRAMQMAQASRISVGRETADTPLIYIGGSTFVVAGALEIFYLCHP